MSEVTKTDQIRGLLKAGATTKEIAEKTGCGIRYIFKVKRQMRLDNELDDYLANVTLPVEREAEKIKAETMRGAEKFFKTLQEVQGGIKTVSVNELIDQERLDPRRIVREALKEIPEGQVARDETFRRDLQIGLERWRELSREEEWFAFRALLPSRRAVWGRPKTIQKLREQDGVT